MVHGLANENWVEMNEMALSRLDQIEHDLRGWADKSITFDFDPAGTDLFSMVELARAYAKRCVDLADSINLLLDANKIVPATVAARALIETIAMGCLYLHDMRRLIAEGDRDRLETRFVRFYAGTKGQTIGPVHVMDAMRHLEKIDGEYVAYLEQKYGLFARFLKAIDTSKDTTKDAREVLSAMKNYDLLSEVVHPNGLGTQFLYPHESNDNEKVARARERFRFLSRMAIWQCHHLLNALEGSIDLPTRYKAAFMSRA